VPPCIYDSKEPLSEQKGQNLPSSYGLAALESIEEPMDYLFESRLSRFTQRKVGFDTPTFAEGLSCSLRQNTDFIFLGEMRDRDECRGPRLPELDLVASNSSFEQTIKNVPVRISQAALSAGLHRQSEDATLSHAHFLDTRLFISSDLRICRTKRGCQEASAFLKHHADAITDY